jgi:diadenylate cyclase
MCEAGILYLAHLGALKIGQLFGFSKPVQEMEGIIRQTVMACELMQKEKVGALIVFSRENRLDEYFKTGTVIGGQVTEQLLRNIFVNKAPLHDGAVIIRDMRIQAAGCLLPLSTNEEIDKNLGTRHRAGIGITEVSDAVVIIVSEETGVISLACGGALKRNFNYNSLKKELLSQLSHSTTPFVTKREKETEK